MLHCAVMQGCRETTTLNVLSNTRFLIGCTVGVLARFLRVWLNFWLLGLLTCVCTHLCSCMIYSFHRPRAQLRCSWKCRWVNAAVLSCPCDQPWQSEEEGSWLREYPVTLMQFFRYLYHNVPDLASMWLSPDFLCALAATVFPFNIRPYSEMVRRGRGWPCQSGWV